MAKPGVVYIHSPKNRRLLEQYERLKKNPDYIDVSTHAGLFETMCQWQDINGRRVKELEERVRSLEKKIVRG